MKTNRNLRALSLVALAAATLLASCTKEPTPVGPVEKKNRTVIEYMVADNNLYNTGGRTYAEDDVNEMERAWIDSYDGHLVVYFYPVAQDSRYAPNRADYDPDPRLLLIQHDATDRIASRVLKRYDRSQDPNDPAAMQAVLADAMALAPADNYGLILWSHGSGWLPKGTYQPLKSTMPEGLARGWDPAAAPSKLMGLYSVPTSQNHGGIQGRSIGVSDSHQSEMDVDRLSAVLTATGVNYDFILFDACHMSCVEVAYELRSNTKYVIGSAAETLAYGFPYDRMMPHMMAREADVVGMAREFYDFYNEQSGVMRSATVAVVRTSGMEALATQVKALCDAGLPQTGLSFAGQQYGRSFLSFGGTFYDLGDFVRRTWPSADLTGFESALTGAVIYQAATPKLFENDAYGTIVVRTHSGLSCYIPRPSTPLSLAAYRTRFGWSSASGMGSLVESGQ